MVPALGALVLLCAAYGIITWHQGMKCDRIAVKFSFIARRINCRHRKMLLYI